MSNLNYITLIAKHFIILSKTITAGQEPPSTLSITTGPIMSASNVLVIFICHMCEIIIKTCWAT